MLEEGMQYNWFFFVNNKGLTTQAKASPPQGKQVAATFAWDAHPQRETISLYLNNSEEFETISPLLYQDKAKKV